MHAYTPFDSRCSLLTNNARFICHPTHGIGAPRYSGFFQGISPALRQQDLLHPILSTLSFNLYTTHVNQSAVVELPYFSSIAFGTRKGFVSFFYSAFFQLMVEWHMPLNLTGTRRRRYSTDQYHTNNPVHPSSPIRKITIRVSRSPLLPPRHSNMPMFEGLNR
jgi:hypothetical protein